MKTEYAIQLYIWGFRVRRKVAEIKFHSRF